MKTIHVLAMSGSLRAGSLNTSLLRMASSCVPAGLTLQLSTSLGLLPLFNPDLEDQEPPHVSLLRHEIAASDALVIASPEYAHGISGVMKNALDWMVSTGVLVDKPVAIWNAAPRAAHAVAALRETLVVMSARLVDSACLELHFRGGDSLSAPENPESQAVRTVLSTLLASCRDDTAIERFSANLAVEPG